MTRSIKIFLHKMCIRDSLRTVIVTAAVYRGFNSELALLLLTFRHRAGVSPYTSSFDLAETCVFAKQSLETILCGRLSPAPLIPKLRGHFAEFLNNTSPDGLRILSSSTCVGLRYGRLINPYSFSRQCTIIDFATYFRSLSPSSTNGWVRLCPCVPVLNDFGGYGISTVCASTTPLGLALAPG